MARTKGTYSLSANIEMLAGAPMDARSIVPAKSDLTTSGTFPYAYVGMETYVVAENKKYRLTASDYTVLANWEEVGTPASVNGVDLKGDKSTEDLKIYKTVTQDEYDALSQNEKNDPNTFYFISNASGGGGTGGGGGGTFYGTTVPDSSLGDNGNIYTQDAEYDIKIYTKSGGNWYVFNTVDKPTQEYNTSNDTPIYDTEHHFGNDGTKIYDALTNDYTQYMIEGWSSNYAGYYEYEDQRYAYGGYELANPINLSKVKLWIGRYEYQNELLTFTLQIQTSQGGQWIDVEDLLITRSLPYPINVFEVAVHQEVYGVRWYHYKSPDKTSGNNATFFGMKLYTLI